MRAAAASLARAPPTDRPTPAVEVSGLLLAVAAAARRRQVGSDRPISPATKEDSRPRPSVRLVAE